MARMIKVNFRNIETLEVESETTAYEISKKFKKYFNFPILAVKIDNEIADLCTPIISKCNIDFYDLSNTFGNEVYTHSVHMLLELAIKRVLGKNATLKIKNSIDNGVYCEINGAEVNKGVINDIKAKMDEIVKEDLLFTNFTVRRMDAIKFFKKDKEYDKANALKYISNSSITLYRLDDVYDYFYSRLAYSTKDIANFTLTYLKGNGFVICTPTVLSPDAIYPYKHLPIIFDTFYEFDKWQETIGVSNASDLNNYISTGHADEVVRLSEIYFDQQLMRVTDSIYNKKDSVKFVLIAGPSSSGKTTTSRKLASCLRTKGFKTHTISTDDYFKERNETPRDENGEFDFENIDTIDLKLFNDHLNKLLKGEKVLLPEYNFITGEKEYKKNWLQIGTNDIVIIEGLHCINEELTKNINRKNKYKIFIGPFTQMNIDDHNRIHTTDIRKLRRIIRDNRTRGYSASDTLKMWDKISKGEKKWIYPFQNDIDDIINSSLVYELAVLKTYAEPLLFSVEETDPVYPEAIRLINFLRNVLPMPSEGIARFSILREFIGGSEYNS